MTADPRFSRFFVAPPQAGRLPPVERWDPPFCGDSQMHIARDGTWFHQGAPIARPELARLFAGLLKRAGDGFFLVTPAEKLSIRVEDAPFLAVTLEEEAGEEEAGEEEAGEEEAETQVLATNMGDRVRLVAGTGWRVTDGIPYVEVRAGLEARLARPVYYALADRAVARDGMLGIISAGHFFALGPA